MSGASTSTPEAAKRTGVRPEIQALRTAAVLMVVVYHLWPGRLTGGFVGVDVFFAISGFLITAHLVKQARRTGTIKLSEFWARRARRLLPASLLVLLVTGIATWIWVPALYWQQFFREIGASALYVQNWVLATDAVDYLAADNEASPVQHFWSLSVEEQFYLVWPLLIVLALAIAAKASDAVKVRTIGAVLAVIVVASLAFSIFLTTTNPPAAYFVTTTRAWEFGLGGLLAIVAASPLAGRVALRTVVAWAGWLLIAYSAFFYTGATPFPGWEAGIPVLGTLAVIWAGTPKAWYAPTAIASLRPVQWVGDISYSVYLWHWPPIILLPFILGHDLGTGAKIAIFIGALVVGYLSKILIEDPTRNARFFTSRKPRVTYSAMVAGMAAVLLVVVPALVVVQQQADRSQQLAQEAVSGGIPCFGAAAMDPDNQPCVNDELGDELVPQPAAAKEDLPAIYTDECQTETDDPTVKMCTFGNPNSDYRVALIGDSHAASWFPAVNEVATNQDWRLDVYYKSACVFNEGYATGGSDAIDSCIAWNDSLQQQLADGEAYDLAVVSYRNKDSDQTGAEGDEGQKRMEQGFIDSWQPLVDRGTQIAAIRDNPFVTDDTARCFATSDYSPSECALTPQEALMPTDPIVLAAEKVDGAHSLDYTDFFCTDELCPLVIGNVVVYRDAHHMTATFAETLSPYLERDILAIG